MSWIDRLLGSRVEARAKVLLDEQLGSDWVSLKEGTYDSTFDFEFGQPYASGTQAALASMPIAGQLREWSVADRLSVLKRAHDLWERNPLAKGAIRVIRGFVVSTGLSVSYRNPKVEEVLENFRAENRKKIQKWERLLFEGLLRDGEVFVRLFHNGGLAELSRSDAAVIKPWLVEYVETEEGNRDNVVAYHVKGETGTGAPGLPVSETGSLEPIPASEIVHCYINAMGYETRGRSELFAIMPWLRAYNDWLANRARINRYKGFLYHLQIKNGTGSQISTKRNAMRQPPAPGSVYVSSDSEVLNEMGGAVGADRVYEDGRALKLMTMVGFPLPEYMLTSGSESNLATARSQQLPALRSFLTLQDIYTQELWRPIYEAVLQAAGIDPDSEVAEYNEEGKKTGKMIRAYRAFEVEAQQIVDEDPKALAEALGLHKALGIVSDPTLAARAGYDWQHEKELIDAQDNAEAEAVMLGKKLGNTLVPVAPGTNGGEPEEEED